MISKEKVKGFIMGVATTSLIVSGTAAFADPVTKGITAVYNNIKIVVDGTTVTPRDSEGNVVEPFIYDGTTYLPVRAVASALNKPVDWDGKTNSIIIGQRTDGTSVPLTSLNYARVSFSMSNVHINQWNNQKPFTLAGKQYDTGIAFDYTPNFLGGNDGVNFVYNLNSQYKKLTGDFSIDDIYKDSKEGNTLVIYGDGKEIYRSKPTLPGDIAKVDVDLSGVNQIKIVFLGVSSGAVFGNPQIR
ncbi:stalk domain-containing protein [Paenibacillus contaminans]|uniref:Copper amine oxidase-like N-terminal domain-containing protein n=1 Tax=Paenibacillus contaminans TaxID=450362 RepID=A0A329MLP9_9BACL|nr:NPCBM/NEW2 domain-containing protein [Paenibacillus contaminans]RAV18807.1 hypothetical protein DQG23_24055 [Paenibacillus contaminans]